MNDVTRLSAKGQIVIPKDVRDRLGWAQGRDLEVIPMGDGVMLRPVARTKRSMGGNILRAAKRIVKTKISNNTSYKRRLSLPPQDYLAQTRSVNRGPDG